MNNRVIHFEIPSDDTEASRKFFGDVFGWTFKKFGDMDYWLAMTGDEKSPGISGAIIQKKHKEQPLVNTISVQNLDDMVGKIEKAGGVIVMPKMAIPSIGHVAYFKDPDGNVHGIIQIDMSLK